MIAVSLFFCVNMLGSTSLVYGFDTRTNYSFLSGDATIQFSDVGDTSTTGQSVDIQNTSIPSAYGDIVAPVLFDGYGLVGSGFSGAIAYNFTGTSIYGTADVVWFSDDMITYVQLASGSALSGGMTFGANSFGTVVHLPQGVEPLCSKIYNATTAQCYNDLQQAIGASMSGDTIRVGSGTRQLTSTVLTTDNITIQGVDQDQSFVVFDGTGDGFFLDQTMGVQLKDITIRHNTTTTGTAIVIGSGSSQTSLDGVVITNRGGEGIHVSSDGDISIVGTRFSGLNSQQLTGAGAITLEQGVGNITIQNSYFENNYGHSVRADQTFSGNIQIRNTEFVHSTGFAGMTGFGIINYNTGMFVDAVFNRRGTNLGPMDLNPTPRYPYGSGDAVSGLVLYSGSWIRRNVINFVDEVENGRTSGDYINITYNDVFFDSLDWGFTDNNCNNVTERNTFPVGGFTILTEEYNNKRICFRERDIRSNENTRRTRVIRIDRTPPDLATSWTNDTRCNSGYFIINVTGTDTLSGLPSAPYTFGPLGGNIGNATGSQTYFARTFTTAITVTDNVGNTTARTVQVTPPLCPQPPTLPDEPEDSKTGGGGSTRPYKDICLDTNPNPDPGANQRGIDYSRSYYDRTCEEEVEPVVVEEIEDETQSDTPPTLQERTEKILQNTSFGEEMTFAYIFAYQQGITTMPSLEEANLLGPLYRRDMAKMISVFATVGLNLKADSGEECIFDDMQLETQESKYYATVSCQLGLMGLKTDGTPAQSFYSDQVVSRAMFGTILSRLLRGGEYNGGVVRYEKHLDALFSKNIMKFIDNPEQDELRGYVMIMMKRINDEEIVPERD